jgi:hypothetical protein
MVNYKYSLREDAINVSLTEKANKEFVEKYKNAVGKKVVPGLDSMLRSVSGDLDAVKDRLHRDCCYKVVEYTDNDGYAKSCKYKKEVICVIAVVKMVSGKEARLQSLDVGRTQLYPGMHVSSNVKTYGVKARKAALKAFLGTECPLMTVGGYSESVTEWNEVVGKMSDFAV